MKLKNFNINRDMISINYAYHYLDLHNCYYLFELTKLDKNKSIELKFKKNNDNRVNKNELPEFILKFKNVSEIYFKEPDPDYPNKYFEQDNNCPDIFGFSFDGNEIMDGPVYNEKTSEDLKTILFTFVTGRSIKIMADSVELIES